MVIDINGMIVYTIFDDNGNLYLYSHGVLYEFSIDSKNMINLERTNYEYDKLTFVDVNSRKLVLAFDDASLKGLMMKDKVKRELEIVKDENASDVVDEVSDHMRYYPEDAEHIDNLENEDEMHLNEHVVFSGLEGKVIATDDNIVALYDTLLFVDNVLKVKTQLCNVQNVYRLCVHSDGIIKFRAVGDIEQIYNLRCEDNILSIVKLSRD